MAAPRHLFVYGTLHPERAPAAMQGVVARLGLLAEATIRGELLDLGEYPGLRLDGARNEVRG